MPYDINHDIKLNTGSELQLILKKKKKIKKGRLQLNKMIIGNIRIDASVVYVDKVLSVKTDTKQASGSSK